MDYEELSYNGKKGICQGNDCQRNKTAKVLRSNSPGNHSFDQVLPVSCFSGRSNRVKPMLPVKLPEELCKYLNISNLQINSTFDQSTRTCQMLDRTEFRQRLSHSVAVIQWQGIL